jgi:hypothetical protein
VSAAGPLPQVHSNFACFDEGQNVRNITISKLQVGYLSPMTETLEHDHCLPTPSLLKIFGWNALDLLPCDDG